MSTVIAMEVGFSNSLLTTFWVETIADFQCLADFTPADEKEEDRLDMYHALMQVLLDGKLHLAPIGSNPQRVIDLGTGTGEFTASPCLTSLLISIL